MFSNRFPLFFALALLASLSLACGEDDEGNPDDKRAEPAQDHPRTVDRLLERATIDETGWGEMEDPCAGLCEPALCGYNCGTVGEQCTRACAQFDSGEQVFVSFDTSIPLPEDEIPEPDPETMEPPKTTYSINTREIPYLERNSLWHVIVYGCDLWDFSDEKKDGLEIEAAAYRHAAVRPGDPQEAKYEFEAYIEPFEGPGMYTAYGFYSDNSEAREAGDFYYSEDGCTVNITNDGSGGIIGTFECTLEHNLGEKAPLTLTNGEVACGVNSLDLPQSVLWPYIIDYSTETPPEEMMEDPMP